MKGHHPEQLIRRPGHLRRVLYSFPRYLAKYVGRHFPHLTTAEQQSRVDRLNRHLSTLPGAYADSGAEDCIDLFFTSQWDREDHDDETIWPRFFSYVNARIALMLGRAGIRRDTNEELARLAAA